LQEATAEELAVIQRLKLHSGGWGALHYAAATHKVKLVQQLLDLGANPAQQAMVDDEIFITPLHLACMGQVKSEEQMLHLTSIAGAIYSLQVGYTMLAVHCTVLRLKALSMPS
jgi:hypothetical protein